MELYNMEQLSKMSDEEKEAVAEAGAQDLENGIREPALTVLKTLSDMGSISATLNVLDYLTGAFHNLIGTPDIPAAKALVNGSGQRLDPGNRAYFTALVAYKEFEALFAQMDSLTHMSLYLDPSFAPVRQTFAQGILDLYKAEDVSGLNYFLTALQYSVTLLTCGSYNLHWGELAQICCWLLENAPDQLGFDPRALLTGTLKSAAQQVCLHPYLAGGSAVFSNQVIENSDFAPNDFKVSPMMYFNPQVRAAFFEQYRLAATLPLYDVHAQLLQEIRRHLSYFSDFEGYDPNVFPKKKLFGNPPLSSQWYTYLSEFQKYE